MLRARSHVRLLPLALTLAAIALTIASEFIALVWFSPIRYTPAPLQSFISLSRGELRFGTRGTGGFFSRYIPPPGARLVPPNHIASDDHTRYFLPRRYSKLQTWGTTIPIHSISAVLLALTAGAMLRRRSRRAGHCSKCGYDLGGLASGVCPECGSVSSPA